jgi:anti-anti-sigma factor
MRADDPARLHVAVRDHSPARVLTVSGDIDRATEGAVLAELRTAIEHHALVVLDLSSVEFFGAAGLAALVQAHEWAKEHQCQLRLVYDSWFVQRSLEVTGLSASFETANDVRTALEGKL